jgi:hypothetical protein
MAKTFLRQVLPRNDAGRTTTAIAQRLRRCDAGWLSSFTSVHEGLPLFYNAFPSLSAMIAENNTVRGRV